MPAADPGLDGPGGPAAIAAWSDGPAAQCRDGRKFRSEARPTGVEGTRPTVQTTEVEWRVVSSSGSHIIGWQRSCPGAKYQGERALFLLPANPKRSNEAAD